MRFAAEESRGGYDCGAIERSNDRLYTIFLPVAEFLEETGASRRASGIERSELPD